MGIKLWQAAVGAVMEERRVRWWTIVGVVLLAIIATVGAVLIGVSVWIRRTFGAISVDQMLMNLPGAGGAETTYAETGYIATFIWQALVLPLGIVLVVFSVAIIVRRRFGSARHYAVRPKKAKLRRLIEYVSAKTRVRRWAPSVLSVATLTVGVTLLVHAVSLPQYIRSITTPLTMEEYYAVPELGSVQTVSTDDSGVAKKNLVVIFLESTEDTLSDESIFDVNMLEPIQEATAGWATIPALQQYEGGGWTMAGIVGTECGIALRGAGIKANDINSNEIGAEELSYLPGATCLGDVLSDAGYTNVFMGGADAQFASKETFLRAHGYDEVKDLNYWLEQGETERSDWGISDRVLMEQAKAEVTQLHDDGQPFNLTMLTLDSHEPAHLYDYCPLSTSNVLSSAFRCSMEQVAGFVSYMDEMGYLDDTVVMMTGDHRKMIAEGGNFWEELSDDTDRTIFNRIWSPDGVQIAREETDQLSIYATLLDVLGLGRSDHRAGIGVSALVTEIDSKSFLDLTSDDYATMMQSRSADLYSKLWEADVGDSIEAGK